MLKKLLKKYTPPYIWKAIKLVKTIPTQIKFRQASKEPAWLEIRQIKELIGSFAEISEYHYDEQSCRQRGQERALFLAKLFGDLRKTKTILELGCSDAMTSVALKENGFSPIALDIIDQRLEVAKNNEIPFLKSSAEEIPIGDNTMDFVFSYNAMEHFNDPQKVLTEINRVLKPGGYFYADFDPLYYSPRGLHAYKKINIPYLQILFKIKELKQYADLHQLNWDELPYVNGYTIQKFQLILKNMANKFELKKYEEILDISGLDLIKRYPSCFKKEGMPFETFIISGIRLLVQKINT